MCAHCEDWVECSWLYKNDAFSGLSEKHIHYAYLLFCAEEILEEYGIVGDKLRLMLAAVATAGGEYGTFPADHDTGSFADGFGGSDGGGSSD